MSAIAEVARRADPRLMQADSLLAVRGLRFVPRLHVRLQASPPARVADIGCREGYTTLALAQAYPLARVVGVEADHPSICRARRMLHERHLEGRLCFHESPPDQPALRGRYDLVTLFGGLEAVGHPNELLRWLRSLLCAGGGVVVRAEEGDTIVERAARADFRVSERVCADRGPLFVLEPALTRR